MEPNQVVVVVEKQMEVFPVAVSATFAAFKAEDRVSFIRPYSPAVQTLEGFRHAKVQYRDGDKAKGTVTTPAKMCTIPVLVLPELVLEGEGEDISYSGGFAMPEVAEKVLLGLLEDQQDVMLKEYIEQGKSSIQWDWLSLDAVFSALTAVRVSERLTKEQVTNWANIALVAGCQKRALEIATEKNDIANLPKYQAGVLNAYVERTAKLAAPIPNIGKEEAEAVEAMLKNSNLGDDMATVLLKKLDTILRPKVLGKNEYL